MYCPKNYAHDHSENTGTEMQYFQQCVSSQIIVVNDDVCLRRNFFIMKHTNLVNEREQSHFMERCGNFSSVYSLHLSFHEPSPIFFYPFVAHTTLNRDCNVFFFLFFYHWAKIFCLPQPIPIPAGKEVGKFFF